MKPTTKQADRIAAYKAHFAEAAALLRVLNHYVENLGHESLDTVHWGDVGSAGGLVEWLRIPAAMVVNIDATDPELPKVLAAYCKQHGLTQPKARRS